MADILKPHFGPRPREAVCTGSVPSDNLSSLAPDEGAAAVIGFFGQILAEEHRQALEDAREALERARAALRTAELALESIPTGPGPGDAA